MGSVYRPNPACRFWYLKYKTITGKWVVESSRLERKEDAKKELKKKEGKIEEGIDITPAIGKLTLDDAFTDLKVNYTNKGRRSMDEMERRVRLHLAPFFGIKRRMTTITTSEVAKYVTKRQG